MSDAEQELAQAWQAMRSFAVELRYVNYTADIHAEISDFLGFSDCIYDWMITAWMMQSRFGTAKEQATQAICKVKKARDDLHMLLWESTAYVRAQSTWYAIDAKIYKTRRNQAADFV